MRFSFLFNLSYIVKFLFLLTFSSVTFAHSNCCKNKERKWSVAGSISTTNTSSSYTPTNHHQGLSLDHTSLSAKGPTGDYIDATTSIALNTSKNRKTRRVRLDYDVEELSLQTTKKTHENLGLKVGRFASHISPGNQEHCCGGHFIKRPLLYRGFLGGHLIDNGAHFGYETNTKSYKRTLGFEVFQGKGLMPKANQGMGLFALMAKHQQKIHKNHQFSVSLSYLLNTLYNQRRTYVSDHTGCCQVSSYTGNHMVMANFDLTSSMAENVDHKLLFELARINKLAERFGKNNYHGAYNLGSVTSFKNLHIGTIEAGVRFDYLRGMKFCSHEGAYLNKVIEKTGMIAWKPVNNHTFRFEYTKQTTKNSRVNNITQVKYTLGF